MGESVLQLSKSESDWKGDDPGGWKKLTCALGLGILINFGIQYFDSQPERTRDHALARGGINEMVCALQKPRVVPGHPIKVAFLLPALDFFQFYFRVQCGRSWLRY